MIKKLLFILILSSLAFTNAWATGYFVSPSGKNTNQGTILLPFQTIKYALTKAKNPGDTVYLRAGTYLETATFPYSDTTAAQIVFTAYNGENVFISDTDVYNTLTRTPTSNPTIFQTLYTGSTFEQIFYNNKPMIQARWPNLPKDKNGDWNFWDSTYWIPGLGLNKTNFPFVPNSMKGVPISRNQLMWKPAYNAIYNKVYFGTSSTALTLQAITTEEQTVFLLPTVLFKVFEKLKIGPNPTNSLLNISLQNDYLGQLVYIDFYDNSGKRFIRQIQQMQTRKSMSLI